MMPDALSSRRADARAIRMIATDLDGTLLRRDKTISAYTAAVFRRCLDSGIRIVPATARPIRAVKMLALPFGVDACVCHNGAVVTVADAVFQQAGIARAAAVALLDVAKRLSGLRAAVEMGDTLYANFDAETIWPGVNATISDFTNLPRLPADKMLFITADPGEIAQIEALLGSDLYAEISENEILMVMNRGARKQNAIGSVAAHFGIEPCQIAAFGDDYNDIGMLSTCGVGIAVANAIDEAKAAAGFVCRSNDEDGVAKWIEENVL